MNYEEKNSLSPAELGRNMDEIGSKVIIPQQQVKRKPRNIRTNTNVKIGGSALSN